MGLREQFHATRAFEDIGQRDFDDTELGPICIGVDAFTGKSIWYRDRAPAPDYATYSDGTPPDPAHENAGDRAARKTRELQDKIARAKAMQHLASQLRDGPQPLYHGFRDAPEPAPSFWRPKLDRAGVWSACATAAFCVVALVFLFT